MVVRYPDREEIIEQATPSTWRRDTAPEAEEGTELIQLSPTDQLAEPEAAIAKAMQAAGG